MKASEKLSALFTDFEGHPAFHGSPKECAVFLEVLEEVRRLEQFQVAILENFRALSQELKKLAEVE